ncbi:Lactonase, 7-bladed beta-propeller domain containing protein [Naviculisporaceae sp. PSN 640]
MLYRVSHAAGAFVVAALALPSVSSATLLYVTSYAGTVTTLDLTLSSPSAGSLQAIATSTLCGAQPSWLTLVGSNLYCLDEAWGQNNGSLVWFDVNDGNLTLLDNVTTIGGPVSAVVYGEDGRGLAVADYGGNIGSGFNTFDIKDPASIQPIQAASWVLDHPGPVADRQGSSHPHQAILDPTGKFLLVPDLGFDRIHVLSVDPTTLRYTEQDPLLVAPGSGPRHGVFVKPDPETTFFYVITEIANQVSGYNVTYMDDNTLSFAQVVSSTTHGEYYTFPAGISGGEIAVSPDNKFLIVSSRNESFFNIPNWDVYNTTKLLSDPLISFSIDPKTGALYLIQTFPAGGMLPRHFSLNKDGTLLAAAAQADGRVVIISRDPVLGVLKEYVADVAIEGGVNCVIWGEEGY